MIFGRFNPETGLVVASAFEQGFSKAQNIRAWEKVEAVPLSRKCLQSIKVRHSIGDGVDNQQSLVHLLIGHNVIACNDVTKITLKPIKHTAVVTLPHTQDQIELLSQA